MKLSKILQILSNETRLNILYWLSEPKKHFYKDEQPLTDEAFKEGACVNLIRIKSGLSQGTISQYMSQLEMAGLVTSTRSGKWTHYQRNEEAMEALLENINKTLKIK